MNDREKMLISLIYDENYNLKNSDILQELIDHSIIQHMEKGSKLIEVGETPQYLFFLVSGVVRGFFLDVNGKDVTDCLICKFGQAIWPSMSINDPARVNLEFLTNGTVMGLPISVVRKIIMEFNEVLMIYNRLLEQALMYHWEIKSIMYQCTAMQRYEWFLAKYPGLIDQISHRYIASFLGITPVTLSRLRKEINQQNQLD